MVAASWRFDDAGTVTGLDYTQAGATWLSFTATPGPTGQTAQAGSPGSAQVFGYDGAGRLTQVQDTVTGPTPSAQTRRYCLDADSNRVAFASDPSVTDLGCPSPQHSYDAADRVTDPGYGYDPLGRTLTVPAADVAGGADLALGYFDTDLVATQTQASTVKSFTLDPAGRLAGATDTVAGTVTRSVVNHYADPTDAPAWISTTTGGQAS